MQCNVEVASSLQLMEIIYRWMQDFYIFGHVHLSFFSSQIFYVKSKSINLILGAVFRLMWANIVISNQS